MSEPTSPATWFDLPVEVRDHVLLCVFVDKTINLGPPGARGSQNSEVSSVLRVSKHFVSRRQVLDAIARYSEIVITGSENLKFTSTILDHTQRSLVRKVSVDFRHHYSRSTPTFYCVSAVFPRIEKVKFDLRYSNYFSPVLSLNQKAKLFQVLRSTRGDYCQIESPESDSEDSSEDEHWHEAEAYVGAEWGHKYPGLSESLRSSHTMTAYKVEEDFSAGHLDAGKARKLMQQALKTRYDWRHHANREFIGNAMSSGTDVECSVVLAFLSDVCGCIFTCKVSFL